MPDRPLSHLTALRALDAVARHGSYTAAARELGVTPAAVGQQVRTLEAWLGAALFRRASSGSARLTPTPRAAAALGALGEGFARLAEAARLLRAPTTTNIITVTVSPAFAAKWLLPRLDGFQGAHPEFEVRLDATDRLADFAHGDADIGVRYGLGQWPGLTATRLFAEEVFPVCSPALLDGPSGLATPADLAGQTLIHDATVAFDARYPTWRAWLAVVGATGVDPERGLRLNASAAVTEAAVAGRGVALGRSVIVGDDLASGRLVRLFPDVRCPLDWSYHTVHRPADTNTPKVAAFRAWLVTQAKS